MADNSGGAAQSRTQGATRGAKSVWERYETEPLAVVAADGFFTFSNLAPTLAKVGDFIQVNHNTYCAKLRITGFSAVGSVVDQATGEVVYSAWDTVIVNNGAGAGGGIASVESDDTLQGAGSGGDLLGVNFTSLPTLNGLFNFFQGLFRQEGDVLNIANGIGADGNPTFGVCPPVPPEPQTSVRFVDVINGGLTPIFDGTNDGDQIKVFGADTGETGLVEHTLIAGTGFRGVFRNIFGVIEAGQSTRLVIRPNECVVLTWFEADQVWLASHNAPT